MAGHEKLQYSIIVNTQCCNIQTFFTYLPDNYYQEYSPHNNQFSIDLSNPVHIEVNIGVKRPVSEVPVKQWNDEAWRFTRPFR